MTDATRLAALERVVEAAQKVAHRTGDNWHPVPAHVDDLRTALSALDALPAPQPQPVETVTLAVWRDPEDGDVRVAIPKDRAEADYRRLAWCYVGTVTLPITRERGA